MVGTLMATLQVRNGSYRVQFSYNRKLHNFTLGRVTADEADSKCRQVDYLLMRLKQGFITLPDGTDIVAFIEHDGQPPKVVAVPNQRKVVTLAVLRDRYLETHSNGSLEASTLYTCRIHFKHLDGILGEGITLSDLTLATLQSYVNKRARKVSPATIRKEMATFRAAWNWGRLHNLTIGDFPNKGLKYAKLCQQPHFMTYEQIDRQVKAGGDIKLFESLYLQLDEIEDLLATIKASDSQPFLCPMVTLAAYTGARRSEMLRMRIEDIDFENQIVKIREKKRSHSENTYRHVPLSLMLIQTLKDWLQVHPGAPYLFCLSTVVAKSNKRSRTTGHKSGKDRAKTTAGRLASVKTREPVSNQPLTRDEVHDHFKRALKDTKWSRVRGFHVLRHSFISACASRGVDQRLLQEWCGHMDAKTSRRYAHLYPSTQKETLRSVFG
jgi:integrase